MSFSRWMYIHEAFHLFLLEVVALQNCSLLFDKIHKCIKIIV